MSEIERLEVAERILTVLEGRSFQIFHDTTLKDFVSGDYDALTRTQILNEIIRIFRIV